MQKLNVFRIEASWKLGQWDDLEKFLKMVLKITKTACRYEKRAEASLGISFSPTPVHFILYACGIKEWVKTIFPVLFLSFFHPYVY